MTGEKTKLPFSITIINLEHGHTVKFTNDEATVSFSTTDITLVGPTVYDSNTKSYPTSEDKS